MLALFFILSLVLVATAISVVVLRNPIFSALALVLNLLTVAAMFASLDAHFLAVVQVVVYAGAIMVLVLFVLMLLNIRAEKAKRPSFSMLSLAGIFGVAFLYVISPLLNQAFSVFPQARNPAEGTVENMGLVLFSKYIFPFEVASILIMAAIVGAVLLAHKRKGPAVSTGGK